MIDAVGDAPCPLPTRVPEQTAASSGEIYPVGTPSGLNFWNVAGHGFRNSLVGAGWVPAQGGTHAMQSTDTRQVGHGQYLDGPSGR